MVVEAFKQLNPSGRVVFGGNQRPFRIEERKIIMPRNEEEDKTIYKVVVNHEEQYSIWFADRDNPPGWNDVGKSGPKAECLAYIKEIWTDMRPLSLRKRMEELARQQNS